MPVGPVISKKLIEVALPLPEINDASAYDKMPGIGAHPKGIHHWWARLPLPVARAVLFASVVDDPSSHPERFPTEEAQAAERERLFGIIRRMMEKQLHKHPEVYAEARAEMLKYCDGKLPPVLDPFAGGGSIPLEAARLGFEAYAADLNPVAVLLNKCNLEIVPRWADHPPVNPEWRNSLLGAPASSRHNMRGAPASSRHQQTSEHRGWTSRGYLPHFDSPYVVQSVTFRLADAVPQHVVAAWREELGLTGDQRASDPRAAELRQRIEKYEDAGHGACYLRDPRVAEIVQKALLHFDGVRYRLLAWCIMPNHVHVLIEPLPGFPLADVVHSWKSFTANEANRLLGRDGPFWQREYYDRFIRNEEHMRAALAYIESNPVNAGLAARPEEWPFSSARFRNLGRPGNASGSTAMLGAAGSAAILAASSALKVGDPKLSRQDAGAPGDPKLSRQDAGAPGDPKLSRQDAGALGGYRGAAGLAADVRYYGQVILERARKRIGHLYPPVRVTDEMAEEHPHLRPYVGRELPVIAWIWARTVPSPNPAARGAHVPLMSTFWLSSKKGSEAWLEPVVEWPRSAGSAGLRPAQDARLPTWRFRVRIGAPKDRAAVKAGTKTGRAQFRCLLTGDPISDDHIKKEGQAGRLGQRLVAIVADTGRGRIYLPATEEHEAIARQAEPGWRPEGTMPNDPRWFSPPLVGLTDYGDLFTPRQLTAMVTLSGLIREVREDVRRDAGSAGFQPADADAYTAAVATFLALALDRCADNNSSLCRWRASNPALINLFARQAIPIVWDFCEGNTLGEAIGSWTICVEREAQGIEAVWTGGIAAGHARLIDAARPWDGLSNVLISTDPPYYDNIGYAALSDFFYVWLRRTIGDLYPDLFATILVPKEPELVAAPERFGGDKRKAKEHFEQGFRRAFAILRDKMDPRFPLTVYYAFKQDDVESGADEGGEDKGRQDAGAPGAPRIDRTTGWETMLEALIGTGFQITATWPVRASQKQRMTAMGTNALASYIVLACRPRPEDAPQTDRRSFVAELKRELPGALRRLQQGNIAPVDFAQAAIGPGMAIYSKYSRVLEASGRPMSVRTALALINQVLTEVLSEQEDEFDNDTRWAIGWFEQHGFGEGDFGDAELLSKAKATSVNGLVEAGIVATKAGEVRLLRPEELKKDWDPATDKRFTVWEATHHLLRLYWHDKAGDEATAALLRKLGSQGDLARELAYRLFNVCERRKWSQEAQAYNALVVGWPELAKLARKSHTLEQLPFEAS